MAWAMPQNSLHQIHQNDDIVQGHAGVIQFAAEEKATRRLRGSSIRTSTSLRRRPARDGFLVWVVYERKYALNFNDPKRRRCPLIGCERDFADPEVMEQHVYECLPQSKGLYRCFECGNKERIGKYHNNGCKEPHQSKGSFAKVANSLRLAKQLFSRQALKRRPQASQRSDIPDLGAHESVLETEHHPSELESNWSGNPVELYGEYFPELEDLDSSMYLSADDIFERGMLSELDSELDNTCGTLPAPTADDTEQYDTEEFEDHKNSRFTAPELDHSQQQESCWRPSQQHLDGETSQRHGYMPSDSPSQNVAPQDQYRHQSLQTKFSDEADRPTIAHDVVSPISPAEDNYQYPNTPDLSPPTRSPYRGTYRNTTPSVSPMSTRDNSLSESDLRVPSIEEHRLRVTPWLDGFGSEMLYAEQGDDMESMTTAESHRDDVAFGNPHPWYSDTHGRLFNSNIITSLPQPLNITKQQVHQEMYHFQSNAGPPSLSSSPLSSPPLCSPSLSPQQAFTPPSPGPKHRCICDFEPGGKEENKASNLKRHQRTCKMFNSTACQSPPPLYTCLFPDCGLHYNRRDDLLAHQRLKNHSRDFELHYTPISLPRSESDDIAFELDSREAKRRRRV